MRVQPFVYPLGAPVILDLVVDDAQGDDPTAYVCVMTLRPEKDIYQKARMTVTFTAADGANRAFWRGVVSPVYLAGRYIAEAVLTQGGVVAGLPYDVAVNVVDGAVR